MSLVGKKVLCVGGNGYVGNYLASRLIQANASVQILSRSGPKHKYPQNKQVDWIIGDIFQIKKIQQKINEADIIIHTVGTLFDTSITSKVAPGGPGTYQALNRDSLKSLLDSLKSKKQIFYLSAVGHPPFIHRYASTKQEAEQLLIASQHKAHIFKPGFIYNWQHRWWSIPLKYNIQLFNKVYPFVHKLTFNGSYLQKFIQQFEQSEPTSLQKMGDALIEVLTHDKTLTHDSDQTILKNDEINQLSQKYRLKIAKQHKP